MATLSLNQEHDIFKGHFPRQPVLPGACMLQIVKEVLAEVTGIAYQLKKASNLKFIAPVDPRLSPEIELKLTYKAIDSSLQTIASLSANEVVCFKLQGDWVELPYNHIPPSIENN